MASSDLGLHPYGLQELKSSFTTKYQMAILENSGVGGDKRSSKLPMTSSVKDY